MPSSSAIKPKSQKDTSPSPSKENGKMHRRSRAGCYTCRLRRKKCDEKRDVCTACRNLRIECHYSRPSWWANAEKRAAHKEKLKENIRVTKQTEKPGLPGAVPNPNTPPSLCHSVPTSSDAFSDFVHTRAASIDSHFSPQFDLDTPKDFLASTPLFGQPHWTPLPSSFPQFPQFQHVPYDIDIREEAQYILNDEQIRKDSSFSTYSALQDSPEFFQQPFEADWVREEQSEWVHESVNEDALAADLFDFPHNPGSPAHETTIEVDPNDQYLLEHFLNNVAPMMFPILDLNQQGCFAQRGAILPALETNKSYLHCCLSIAALHMRATGMYPPESEVQIDTAIMDHRCIAIGELCAALNDEHVDPSHILETMLAMIIFESNTAPLDAELNNVPWHQHLAGAKDLIDRMNLLDTPVPADSRTSIPSLGEQQASPSHLPFNATLASWIDIIGGTLLGRVPLFAESYRHKLEHSIPSGISELTGCDDRVMYLISEITSLDVLKTEGKLDNVQLCTHITSLGERISATEPTHVDITDVFSPNGAVRPKQLCRNVTALYRIAARIYLCSLVPGFDQRQPNIRLLVDSFVSIITLVPAAARGYDKSLIWPLLVAGAASSPDSTFRAMFAERAEMLGKGASIGSYARLHQLLHELWSINDPVANEPEPQFVSWRDLLHSKEMQVLLI